MWITIEGVYFWNNNRGEFKYLNSLKQCLNHIFWLKLMKTFLWENPIWLSHSPPGNFGIHSLAWEIIATLFSIYTPLTFLVSQQLLCTVTLLGLISPPHYKKVQLLRGVCYYKDRRKQHKKATPNQKSAKKLKEVKIIKVYLS